MGCGTSRHWHCFAGRCESAHAAQAPPPAKRTKAGESTDKRDKSLPTTVPMPKDVSDVNNVHVATLLAEGVRVTAQPAEPAPAGVAEPVREQLVHS